MSYPSRYMFWQNVKNSKALSRLIFHNTMQNHGHNHHCYEDPVNVSTAREYISLRVPMIFPDWFSFVWLLCRHIVRNMPIMRTRWIGVLAFVLGLSSRSGLRLLIWHQLEQQQYGIFSGHPWWRHQMEILSSLMAICVANSPVPSESPTQRPVTRSFDIFFDLRLNNRLRKNREAGDLRRYRGHYDPIVMIIASYLLCWCHKALYVTTGWYQDKHRVMQSVYYRVLVHTLSPRQDGHHFPGAFWNAFSSMKIYEFRLRIHWSLFIRSNYQYSSIGSANGLAPTRRQAIIWTNYV